jgi:acyl-coenzyme A thioesterase 9
MTPFRSRILTTTRTATTTTMTTTESKNLSVVGRWKTPAIAHLWGRALKEFQPTPGPKPPSHSAMELTYDFSTDTYLRELYLDPHYQLRYGKLLEDMDAAAGNVCYYHACEDADDPPFFVTVSVDKIRLQPGRPLTPPPPSPSSSSCPTATINDQKLQGCITYVGRSSMEIQMSLVDLGTNRTWLEAYFTFVTSDPATNARRTIPSLLIDTNIDDDDMRRFEAGRQRALRKRQMREQNRAEPHGNDDEALALLDEAGPLINLPSLASNNDAVLMHTTKLQAIVLAQLEQRNMHNRIFGGFLMRTAYELAFSTAYVFGGAWPIFEEADEVSFAKPVHVGDLLAFHSRGLYVDEENTVVHVEVETWITHPEQKTAHVSNQFYFTLRLPLAGRRVLPGSIDEARRIVSRKKMRSR